MSIWIFSPVNNFHPFYFAPFNNWTWCFSLCYSVWNKSVAIGKKSGEKFYFGKSKANFAHEFTPCNSFLFSFSLSLSLILCITILWFRRVISTCIRKFLYFPCHSSARDFSPPFHVNESQTHYPRTVVLITLLCNFQQQKVVMEWTPSFSFTFCFFFCLLYSDFNFHVDKKKFFFLFAFQWMEKWDSSLYVNVLLYLCEPSKFRTAVKV